MTEWTGVPFWKPLTGLDDEDWGRGRLLGALLTTFDPPDAGVLVEEYLPAWLQLKNSYTDEGKDRLRYFAELSDELRRLKGHIAIISSAGQVGASAEAWIWNYIRRFEVGAMRAAVQHAKLWMFHRAPAGARIRETLELVVSSANLTRDGLRGQIQAGWRCVLELDARGSDARRKTWGILPAFLAELGKASGMGGPAMIDGWLALLRRCGCPPNIEFVASVPGTHSAATLVRKGSTWGAAGLRAYWSGKTSPKISVMAPTIGHWTDDTFKAWTRIAGVEPGRISVAWVGASHPWAGAWQLDPESETALTGSGIRWLEVPRPFDDDWESPLCEEHQQTDSRWSHAKIYELREGARRRLLITSANLSRAAWGDPQGGGGLAIDNFELGVLMPVHDGFSERLRNRPFQRATCDIDYTQLREPPIAWLAAEWDGSKLSIECRPSSGVVLALHIEVTVARSLRGLRVSVAWSRDSIARAAVSWVADYGTPLLVCVETDGGDTRATAVHDLRKIDDGHMLCGEFDENLLRETLDLLLEEKYGYLPVSEANGTAADGETLGLSGAAPAGDYSVPAYVDARRRFRLVDNWWKELCDADKRTRPFIVKDGMRICARWSAASKKADDRGIRLAARIAAEELALRIRRFT